MSGGGFRGEYLGSLSIKLNLHGRSSARLGGNQGGYQGGLSKVPSNLYH